MQSNRRSRAWYRHKGGSKKCCDENFTMQAGKRHSASSGRGYTYSLGDLTPGGGVSFPRFRVKEMKAGGVVMDHKEVSMILVNSPARRLRQRPKKESSLSEAAGNQHKTRSAQQT